MPMTEKEMMERIAKNRQQTVTCECGCGAFVLDLVGSKYVHIAYHPWAGYKRCDGLWNRIKIALKIIVGKSPELYDIEVDREDLFTAAIKLKITGREIERQALKARLEKEREKKEGEE